MTIVAVATGWIGAAWAQSAQPWLRHQLQQALSQRNQAPTLAVTRPFILVTPTYGGGEAKGAVPAPVIRFLNEADNRALLVGVIAAGNTNFGAAYGLAGRIIAEKCGVPLLYRFELLGTDEDVTRVRKGVREFWTRPS